MQRQPPWSADRGGGSPPWWRRIAGRGLPPREPGAASFDRGRHPVRGCRGGRVLGLAKASTESRSMTSAVSATLLDRVPFYRKAKGCAAGSGQSEDTFH